MKKRLLQVLLTDSESYPQHGMGNPQRVGPKSTWERWRGKPILVETPPSEPNSHWQCGTDVVFRVAQQSLIEVFGQQAAEWPVFVCRHQIQIGD